MSVAVKIDTLKLDLACGQSKREGFVGVDRSALPGVDVVCDLETFPWPWADDSVQEIFCSHYVEHTRDLIAFMNEVYRVCQDGATVTLVHPYLKSVRAFQDPAHVRFIPEQTWAYFSREWRTVNKLDHYPITAHFDPITIVAIYAPPWHLKSDEARQFAVTHYWDVIQDLTVTLMVKK